jgi:hypothetical protein
VTRRNPEFRFMVGVDSRLASDFPTVVLVTSDAGMRWRDVLTGVKRGIEQLAGAKVTWERIYVWAWDGNDEGHAATVAKRKYHHIQVHADRTATINTPVELKED